jgi:hypothetical protein
VLLTNEEEEEAVKEVLILNEDVETDGDELLATIALVDAKAEAGMTIPPDERFVPALGELEAVAAGGA